MRVAHKRPYALVCSGGSHACLFSCRGVCFCGSPDRGRPCSAGDSCPANLPTRNCGGVVQRQGVSSLSIEKKNKQRLEIKTED